MTQRLGQLTASECGVAHAQLDGGEQFSLASVPRLSSGDSFQDGPRFNEAAMAQHRQDLIEQSLAMTGNRKR
jgi:hypothetical protein